MQRFWEPVIRPVVEAADAKVVVEVGTERGLLTHKMLEFARDRDLVVHSIDPVKQFPLDAWTEEFGEKFVFHRDRSLKALPRIAGIDVCIIDGDHNWYTVYQELRVLRDRAREQRRAFPIVLLHDVGWPYGRRDMYYDPETIPDEYVHPHAKRGMVPGSPDLVEGAGLNPHLDNALEEGGRRNGVRTAVEDFMSDSGAQLKFVDLPGFNGIGVLLGARAGARNKKLAAVLSDLESGTYLEEIARETEEARVRLQIRASELRGRQEADAARHSELKSGVEKRDEALEKARGEVARLTEALKADQAKLAEATAAKGELETTAKAAKGELETTAKAHRQLERKFAERTEQLQEARRLASEGAQAVGELEIAARAREDLEKRLAERTETLQKAHQEVGELAQTLRGSHADLDDQHKRVESAINDRVDLAAKAAAANAELEIATRNRDQLSEQLAERDEALADARREAAELGRTLPGVRAELEVATSAREQLTEQLAEATEALEKSSREASELSAALPAAKAELEAATRARQELEEQLAERTEALEKASREASELGAELPAAKAELEAATSARQQLEKELAESAEALREASELADALPAAEAELEAATSARQQLERELDERREALHDARREAAEASEALRAVRAELGERESRLEAVIEERLELASEVAGAKADLEVTVRAREQLEQQVADRTKALRASRAEAADLGQALIRADEQISKRQAELQRLLWARGESAIEGIPGAEPARPPSAPKKDEEPPAKGAPEAEKAKAKSEPTKAQKAKAKAEKAEAEKAEAEKPKAEKPKAEAAAAKAEEPKAEGEKKKAAAKSKRPKRTAAEVEKDERETFRSRYMALTSEGDDLERPDALHIPPHSASPTSDGGDSDSPSVDVVVCVHDALDDVRHCLWSLIAKASRPFGLILVNDGSDAETSAYLRAVVDKHPDVTLIENVEPPHGYTVAANLGMNHSSGDYVVLLNSDTVVSHGWLERIVACGEAHPQVGLLGPLSNAASHQSVPAKRDATGWATNPLPEWLTVDGMAQLVAATSSGDTHRLPFINGFCYVIKREVIDRIGIFDQENFEEGYCEENDYSWRAREADFELGVVDDAYVYHAKSKSYGTEGRQEIAQRHYRRFLDKHGEDRVNAIVDSVESDESLEHQRERLAELTAEADALEGSFASLVEPLDVTFVLGGMPIGGGGGVHSIYQEVSGLRRLGIPARAALGKRTWDRAVDTYDDADDVFVPFANDDELLEVTRESDVIVATHHITVGMVQRLLASRDDFLPAYYIQDYEPLFYPEGTANSDDAVLSYGSIPGQLRFAKTHWLCNVVARLHQVPVTKVEPSLDTGVYHSEGRRPLDESGPVRVVAMVRPRTPRRQPLLTYQLVAQLKRDLGDEVEVVTFGCSDDDLAAMLNSVGNGVADEVDHRAVMTRADVAASLRDADIFLDCSTYQAFGRTALEAMACGCTAVVPEVGGIHEFARHDENALLVDMLDSEAVQATLVDLVADRERLRRLQVGGKVTAGRYSVLRAALSEYVAFSRAHAARIEGASARESLV